jgi:hypothetical protein
MVAMRKFGGGFLIILNIVELACEQIVKMGGSLPRRGGLGVDEEWCMDYPLSGSSHLLMIRGIFHWMSISHLLGSGSAFRLSTTIV